LQRRHAVSSRRFPPPAFGNAHGMPVGTGICEHENEGAVELFNAVWAIIVKR
jgi:hypothetical protein